MITILDLNPSLILCSVPSAAVSENPGLKNNGLNQFLKLNVHGRYIPCIDLHAPGRLGLQLTPIASQEHFFGSELSVRADDQRIY